MGDLKISDVQNTDIGRRAILVSPPEPPAEYLMGDPKESIYLGRTAVFNVPFYWNFKRLTNPHIAITGITGSGKSIDKDEEVFIRKDGEIKKEKIGKLIDNLINQFGAEYIDDFEGVSNPGVEVYSFDKNLKGRWSKVHFAARKKADDKLYLIKTASGREIKTTKYHNLVIFRDGCIFSCSTLDAKKGDYIPIPREIKINEQHSPSAANDISLGVLSNEFMRLLGYYVSEGIIVKNRDFRISNTNPEVLKDIEFCMSLFGKPKEEKKNGKIVGYRFSNPSLVKIISSQNCIGNSAEKRVPMFIFNLNNNLVAQYLRSYFEGDGTVEKNSITIVTKSKGLADDTLYLLLKFGIVGRVRRIFKKSTNSKHKGDYYYRITISGRDQIARFSQIGFVSKEKNENLFRLLKKSSNTNVDVIPGIAEIIKRITEVTDLHTNKKERQMIYAIKNNLRRPSRNYLSLIVNNFEKKERELHSVQNDIKLLSSIPKKEAVVALSKNYDSELYNKIDESWRRLKFGLTRTRMSTINKAIEAVNTSSIQKEAINIKFIQKEEIKAAFKNVFHTLNISMSKYDSSLYEFCYGFKNDIAYDKIESAAKFCIQEYTNTLNMFSMLKYDIEFLKLLSSSDLFWDKIIEIKEINNDSPFVYDLCTEDEVFLAGFGGMFVHNSYLIKTFLLRASLVWNANAVIIDWAGEYKAWVKQVNGMVVALGKGSYLNLLDLGGMKPSDRIKQVVRSLEILTDIGQYPEQRRLIEEAIEKAYLNAGFKLAVKEQKDALGNPLRPPTLKDVQKILQQMLEAGTYEFPAELENAIYKIKKFTLEGDDYFAEQSTIDLDKLLSSGLVAIDLSGLPDETFRALAALTILQFVKEKMRMEGWKPEKGIKLIVVLDEAWKISKDENSDAVMIVREGRKYQFALIVASQTPTDISEIIFSNVGTVIMLRLKFEKYLDYLQNSLRFSNYIRQQILSFGVGQAAISMAYEQTTPFSETFILKRIDGEEPIVDYFLDIFSVLTEAQRRDETMPKSFSMERTAFKKRLREMGLSDQRVEEISTLFEKKAKHMDAIDFVIELERGGVNRKTITMFFRELGIDDSTIINIFTKADQKKSGATDRELTQVTLD